MNKFLAGSTVVLGLIVATVGVAADPRSEEVKGSAVTITGCVAGSDSDSFVLTHVQRISPPGAPTTQAALGANGMTGGEAEVIYWLSKDSIKKMRGHVGQKVEVAGTITDVSRGTVDVKQHPGKSGPDNKVEVDARGKSASAKTDRPVEPGPAPAPGTRTEEKKTLPVHRIDVDTVKMIATTCP
jgi:hypothetical protein